MLILHRRAGEAILIGSDVRIVVLASDGGGMRLGIDAPSHVPILREEIVREVEVENRKAWIATEEAVEAGGLEVLLGRVRSGPPDAA